MTYLTPENTPLFNVSHPTKQQVFDAVVGHAAKMPAPSRTTDEDAVGCLYRTEDGSNACFIGGLLTDAEAAGLDNHPNTLSSAVSNLAGKRLLPERLLHRDLRPLLVDLQLVHDDYLETRDWPEALKRVAAAHGLDASSVTGA